MALGNSILAGRTLRIAKLRFHSFEVKRPWLDLSKSFGVLRSSTRHMSADIDDNVPESAEENLASTNERPKTALAKVAELDEQACSLYYAHPLAFHNFPLELINWRENPASYVQPVPFVFLGTSPQMSFTHLTPWACVVNSTVGIRGNIGLQDYMMKSIKPYYASQEIVLGDKPLIPGGQSNAVYEDYMKWVEKIEEKLIDHVTDNRTSYGFITQDILETNRDAVRAIIKERFISSVVSTKRGEKHIRFKAKLYVKEKKLGNQPSSTKKHACMLDEEVARTTGLVRNDVPVYEANGRLVPLEDRILNSDDVVCMQSRFFVTNTSSEEKRRFTLVHQLGSIVILRRAKIAGNDQPETRTMKGGNKLSSTDEHSYNTGYIGEPASIDLETEIRDCMSLANMRESQTVKENHTTTINRMFSQEAQLIFNEKSRRQFQTITNRNRKMTIQDIKQWNITCGSTSTELAHLNDASKIAPTWEASGCIGDSRRLNYGKEKRLTDRHPWFHNQCRKFSKEEQAVVIIQSAFRGWVARREYRRTVRRGYAVRELIETEQNYLLILRNIHLWYMKPLFAGAGGNHEYIQAIVSGEDINIIFSQIANIHNLHHDLLCRMHERFDSWSYAHCIGDIFLESFTNQHLDLYTHYVNNFDDSADRLKYLRTNPSHSNPMNRFLEERREIHNTRHDLSDMLIAPVQRIPRYVLLLEQVLKYTNKAHMDYDYLSRALLHLRDIASTVNKRKDAQKQAEELDERIVGSPMPMRSHGRFLVDEYEVFEVEGKHKKLRRIFLMNDVFLCTTPTITKSSSTSFFHLTPKPKTPATKAKARPTCKFNWMLDLQQCDFRDTLRPMNQATVDAGVHANAPTTQIQRRESNASSSMSHSTSSDGNHVAQHNNTHDNGIMYHEAQEIRLDIPNANMNANSTAKSWPLDVYHWQPTGAAIYTFLMTETDRTELMSAVRNFKKEKQPLSTRCMKDVVRMPPIVSRSPSSSLLAKPAMRVRRFSYEAKKDVPFIPEDYGVNPPQSTMPKSNEFATEDAFPISTCTATYESANTRAPGASFTRAELQRMSTDLSHELEVEQNIMKSILHMKQMLEEQVPQMVQGTGKGLTSNIFTASKPKTEKASGARSPTTPNKSSKKITAQLRKKFVEIEKRLCESRERLESLEGELKVVKMIQAKSSEF
eukprot:CFRG1683T1